MKFARLTLLSAALGATMALAPAAAIADSYLSTSSAFNQQAELSQADTIVILLPQDTDRVSVSGMSRATQEHIQRAISAADFKGRSGQILEVTAPAGSDASRVILLGLGDLSSASRSSAERAGASLANHINATNAQNVVIDTQLLNGAENPGLLIAATAHGIDLRNYRYDKFISDADDRPAQTYTWRANEQAEGEYNRLLAVANGVFLARELVNEPPATSSPLGFIEKVRYLADMGVEITVLGPEQVRDMGMGALYGVGQGSNDGAHMLVLHWQGSNDAPLALVGKGNTFDTGGYNIKSAAGMRTMKGDAAGGAAVVGAIKALAGQNAAVNVVGVVPLSQNMISADAILPGDVLVTGSGLTVEVNNTDAEGRLILADGLWYARTQYEPRAMVNIATLTGAKVGAVGTAYSAVFSDHDDVLNTLMASGDTTSEELWRLPMHDSYKTTLSSTVADMINGGSPGASAGAMFLREFAGDTPWAHVDMAGNGIISSASGVNPVGATGYGVRLLTEWVHQYSQQN